MAWKHGQFVAWPDKSPSEHPAFRNRSRGQLGCFPSGANSPAAPGGTWLGGFGSHGSAKSFKPRHSQLALCHAFEAPGCWISKAWRISTHRRLGHAQKVSSEGAGTPRKPWIARASQFFVQMRVEQRMAGPLEHVHIAHCGGSHLRI